MMGDGAPYGRDYADPESPRPDGLFVSQNHSQPRRSVDQLRSPSGFGGLYAPPPPRRRRWGSPEGSAWAALGRASVGCKVGLGLAA